MSSYSPRNKPASLGVLLASSREAAARYAGTVIDREQWRHLVGERIALRTEPGAKRGRELTVHVASASWAQELSLLVNEIVARLKSAGIHVDTVRFRVKEIAARTRDPERRVPVYRRATLPSALTARLDLIADPELREAIGEAASLWLALDETPSKPPPPTQRTAHKAAARAQAKNSGTAAEVSAPTSARPNAPSPRDAGSRNARLERRTSPAPARPKYKP